MINRRMFTGIGYFLSTIGESVYNDRSSSLAFDRSQTSLLTLITFLTSKKSVRDGRIYNNFLDLYNHNLNEASKIDENLYNEMRTLQVPSDLFSKQERILFRAQYLDLLRRHRGIMFDVITDQKLVEILEDYVLSSRLLHQCLKLSSVSSRNAIENKLLSIID